MPSEIKHSNPQFEARYDPTVVSNSRVANFIYSNMMNMMHQNDPNRRTQNVMYAPNSNVGISAMDQILLQQVIQPQRDIFQRQMFQDMNPVMGNIRDILRSQGKDKLADAIQEGLINTRFGGMLNTQLLQTDAVQELLGQNMVGTYAKMMGNAPYFATPRGPMAGMGDIMRYNNIVMNSTYDLYRQLNSRMYRSPTGGTSAVPNMRWTSNWNPEQINDLSIWMARRNIQENSINPHTGRWESMTMNKIIDPMAYEGGMKSEAFMADTEEMNRAKVRLVGKMAKSLDAVRDIFGTGNNIFEALKKFEEVAGPNMEQYNVETVERRVKYIGGVARAIGAAPEQIKNMYVRNVALAQAPRAVGEGFYSFESSGQQSVIPLEMYRGIGATQTTALAAEANALGIQNNPKEMQRLEMIRRKHYNAAMNTSLGGINTLVEAYGASGMISAKDVEEWRRAMRSGGATEDLVHKMSRRMFGNETGLSEAARDSRQMTNLMEQTQSIAITRFGKDQGRIRMEHAGEEAYSSMMLRQEDENRAGFLSTVLDTTARRRMGILSRGHIEFSEKRSKELKRQALTNAKEELYKKIRNPSIPRMEKDAARKALANLDAITERTDDPEKAYRYLQTLTEKNTPGAQVALAMAGNEESKLRATSEEAKGGMYIEDFGNKLEDIAEGGGELGETATKLMADAKMSSADKYKKMLGGYNTRIHDITQQIADIERDAAGRELTEKEDRERTRLTGIRDTLSREKQGLMAAGPERFRKDLLQEGMAVPAKYPGLGSFSFLATQLGDPQFRTLSFRKVMEQSRKVRLAAAEQASLAAAARKEADGRTLAQKIFSGVTGYLTGGKDYHMGDFLRDMGASGMTAEDLEAQDKALKDMSDWEDELSDEERRQMEDYRAERGLKEGQKQAMGRMFVIRKKLGKLDLSRWDDMSLKEKREALNTIRAGATMGAFGEKSEGILKLQKLIGNRVKKFAKHEWGRDLNDEEAWKLFMNDSGERDNHIDIMKRDMETDPIIKKALELTGAATGLGAPGKKQVEKLTDEELAQKKKDALDTAANEKRLKAAGINAATTREQAEASKPSYWEIFKDTVMSMFPKSDMNETSEKGFKKLEDRADKEKEKAEEKIKAKGGIAGGGRKGSSPEDALYVVITKGAVDQHNNNDRVEHKSV